MKGFPRFYVLLIGILTIYASGMLIFSGWLCSFSRVEERDRIMTGYSCNNFVLIKVFSYGARVSSFTFYVISRYITPATFIANNKVYSRLYVFVKVLRHGRHEFLFLFLADKLYLTFFPVSPAAHHS